MKKLLHSVHGAHDARLQTEEGIGRKEMIAPEMKNGRKKLLESKGEKLLLL